LHKPTAKALLETLLDNLDMRINALKSAFNHFGPRHDADCANLTMKNREAIAWDQVFHLSVPWGVFCEWS